MELAEAFEPLAVPPETTPILVIVVDTEEEFDWNRPLSRSNTAVSNATAQVRGQEVIARHGGHATYAITYPMTCDDGAIAALLGLANDFSCEIGAHLHPWVTPPHDEPVSAFSSYACNLEPGLEHAKIERLVQAVGAMTGRRPTVFRAGRYGLGRATLPMLSSAGITVDTSVVPATSFAADGGPDFRGLSPGLKVYHAEPPVLEIPLSCGFAGYGRRFGDALYPCLTAGRAARLHLGGIAARLRLLERIRLTPEGTDLPAMIRLTRALLAEGIRVFSLSYHSPSLVPGFTPYVRDRRDLDDFLARLDGYLSFFTASLGGRVLAASELPGLFGRVALAAGPS